jgi:hypothetical protein
MLLPNCKNAFVPIEKITNYLLDTTHPHGKTKAVFFIGIGYSPDHPMQLQGDLEELACRSETNTVTPNNEGIKYVVVAPLIAPNGKTDLMKTVWIVEHQTDRPRLITAYPN